MFAGLFNIKNDRRLSAYLYRGGFVFWLVYLVLGSPALHIYGHYRNDAGVLSVVLIVVGFSMSMVYDFFNNRSGYEQKKKWLVISYLILFSFLYFFIFKDKGFQMDWLHILKRFPGF